MNFASETTPTLIGFGVSPRAARSSRNASDLTVNFGSSSRSDHHRIRFGAEPVHALLVALRGDRRAFSLKGVYLAIGCHCHVDKNEWTVHIINCNVNNG
jgi:hypothetical protein